MNIFFLLIFLFNILISFWQFLRMKLTWWVWWKRMLTIIWHNVVVLDIIFRIKANETCQQEDKFVWVIYLNIVVDMSHMHVRTYQVLEHPVTTSKRLNSVVAGVEPSKALSSQWHSASDAPTSKQCDSCSVRQYMCILLAIHSASCAVIFF